MRDILYKKDVAVQLSFSDFNQPLGLKLDENNRWIQQSKIIPWDKIEKKICTTIPQLHRNDCQACSYGLIQKHYGYSDRELVEQIREKPYYQYFIGLTEYQTDKPFSHL